MGVAVSDASLGLTDLLDLEDLQWEFRALGCACSAPTLWGEYDGRDEYILTITTEAGIRITLFDDRNCFIDSDCDLIWPDSVEWKVFALLITIVGAVVSEAETKEAAA